jgi:hypothetical protein
MRGGNVVRTSKYHSKAGATNTPKIMFKVGGLQCFVNSVQEMEEVLDRLCTKKDGMYVVRE